VLVHHGPELWSAEHTFGWQGGLIQIPVRMTVIRLADGRLVLHSPIPISPELRAELEALGPVGFILVPKAHGKFADAAAQLYPGAAVHRPLVAESPADWAGQLETLAIEGWRLEEVALFHRPSRTLVLTDLCFNIQRSDFRIARFFFKANDMWRRFGPSRILRNIGVSDRAALARSLERMLAWDFERILPGHGDPIERGGPAALRAAWP
jgi:uncharacterized protein DUF4336